MKIIKIDSIKKVIAGIDLDKGSLILTCITMAKNIIIAIPDAENLTTSGIHNPAINPIENTTFRVPTRYIIQDGKP